MKINVGRSELMDALSAVGRGLSSRSTLPILSGILITADKDGMGLQSTDLEVSVRSRVTAGVEDEGSTVLPGKLLSEIVRTLPEAAVSIKVEGDQATIQCQQSSFSLKVLSPEDFPKFPEVDVSQTVVLDRGKVAETVRQVGRAVSKDETRPILNGILLTIEAGQLRMAATDSYRLAAREVFVEGEQEDFAAVVPGRVLEDVARMSECCDSISLGVAENQFIFTFGTTEFVSRRIEGTYPNYKQLIPKEIETKVHVGRQELGDAVKRVSLLAQHNAPLRLSVSVSDATLTVSANSQDVGEATESLMVEAEGQDVEIAFNHAFLTEGIAAPLSDCLLIEVVSPLKPGLIRAPEEEGFLYLLMPVRLG